MIREGNEGLNIIIKYCIMKLPKNKEIIKRTLHPKYHQIELFCSELTGRMN